MTKRDVAASRDKMALVAEVAKRWGIGRNDALKLTMDSMREALTTGKAGKLRFVIGKCVIKGCTNDRQSGRATCRPHHTK